MVQLRTQRTALFLYAVLLVLPTLVLGALQWRQIELERETELNDLPDEADYAAQRLADVLRNKLQSLVAIEEAREFHQYGATYCPDESCTDGFFVAPSPLVRDERPDGVLAWFDYGPLETQDDQVRLFFGAVGSDTRASLETLIRPEAAQLIERLQEESDLRGSVRIGEFKIRSVPLGVVVAHCAGGIDPQCLRDNAATLATARTDLGTSAFRLAFSLGAGGPQVVAWRRVRMDVGSSMRTFGDCLSNLGRGWMLVQGFFIDPVWLFTRQPSDIARSVLDRSQRYVPPGAPDCCDGRVEYHAEVRPVAELGLETWNPEDRNWGLLRVAVDSASVQQRFRSQQWRFLALAMMLLVSLGTGIALLLRSVEKDLEQARRTENFVAAVTHELRTPLSSIKLHGEMLLDGWAKDPAKQQEYYRRIVRETERLAAMVERVLETSRLSAGKTRVGPADLNQAVRALGGALMAQREGERSDVVFELAEDLPEVQMSNEAVASIVINLVENARKYAPVDWSAPEPEPIRVVTRQIDGRVVLEVLDRGPGVPPEERERIFQAFYRVGDEKTRQTRGTGLGLHLVHLHAQALGGRVAVESREGGGSVFRVSLIPAPSRD